MPDFTMCAEEGCPFSKQCKRNVESGTKADKYQSWAQFRKTGSSDEPENCEGYWEAQ